MGVDALCRAAGTGHLTPVDLEEVPVSIREVPKLFDTYRRPGLANPDNIRLAVEEMSDVEWETIAGLSMAYPGYFEPTSVQVTPADALLWVRQVPDSDAGYAFAAHRDPANQEPITVNGAEVRPGDWFRVDV
jgi:hypothetical protein